jgi:hypothetical protein
MTRGIIVTPQVCEFCGCTPDNACNTPDGPCEWANDFRTVCSAPACIEKAIYAAIEIYSEFIPAGDMDDDDLLDPDLNGDEEEPTA